MSFVAYPGIGNASSIAAIPTKALDGDEIPCSWRILKIIMSE